MPPAEENHLAAIRLLVRRGFDLTPQAWWFSGDPRSSTVGWNKLFEAANWHCVYCRKNLSLTIEDLVASTTDHIVPQHLFPQEKGTKLSPNFTGNLVPSCSVCNSLKASWYPGPDDAAWQSRQSFIHAAREFIRQERTKKMRSWSKHIGAAKVVIWNPSKHPDFVD